MSSHTLPLLTIVSVILVGNSTAAEPATNADTTKATFLITGLHCPPCTKTVEAGVLRTKGVRSASVDWKGKTAKIEFDESQVTSQVIAQQIAETPHMMGARMHYSGWLALRAEGVKDEKTAAAAKTALKGIAGVAEVAIYPAQDAIGVLFDSKGKVTTAQLIDALQKAGVKAGNLN